MKLIQKLAFCLFPALLCFGLTGCTTPPRIQPLSGGYEETIHPVKSMDPADARVSLDYRGPDGRTILVWPSLYGTDAVIKGDVAFFVGDKAYVSSDPDDPRGTKPRLFAAQPPTRSALGQTLPSHSGLLRDQCLMFPASDQIADKSRMTKETNFNRARRGRTDTN